MKGKQIHDLEHSIYKLEDLVKVHQTDRKNCHWGKKKARGNLLKASQLAVVKRLELRAPYSFRRAMLPPYATF